MRKKEIISWENDSTSHLIYYLNKHVLVSLYLSHSLVLSFLVTDNKWYITICFREGLPCVWQVVTSIRRGGSLTSRPNMVMSGSKKKRQRSPKWPTQGLIMCILHSLWPRTPPIQPQLRGQCFACKTTLRDKLVSCLFEVVLTTLRLATEIHQSAAVNPTKSLRSSVASLSHVRCCFLQLPASIVTYTMKYAVCNLIPYIPVQIRAVSVQDYPANSCNAASPQLISLWMSRA